MDYDFQLKLENDILNNKVKRLDEIVLKLISKNIMVEYKDKNTLVANFPWNGEIYSFVFIKEMSIDDLIKRIYLQLFLVESN